MGLLTFTLSVSTMAQEHAVPLKNGDAAAPAESPEELSAEEQALKLEIEARLSQFSDDFQQLQLVGSMSLSPDAKLGINKNFVSVLEDRMNSYNQRYNSLDVMWTTYTQAQQMDIANDEDLMTMVANIEALKQSVKDTLDARSNMVKAISDFATADQFIISQVAVYKKLYKRAFKLSLLKKLAPQLEKAKAREQLVFEKLQASYDYAGRYFADISLAGVHSARLPEGNREAISHSFTLGWNLAKENFLKDTFVDDLLLSASYSNLSEDIDVYMSANNTENYFYLYEANWATDGSGFGWNEGVTTERAYSKSGSNPALDFIHRKELSFTLRGSFFNKLIAAELTYFNTDMDGFIIQDPTAFPSYLSGGLSGSSFKPAINNNIQNRKGLDFSITAQKQFGKVHAQLGVVGTYLTTEWKKYDEIVDPTATWRNSKNELIHEGNAIDAISGYNCLGFYTLDDFDVTTNADGFTKYTLKKSLPTPKIGGTIQPGDLKYEDVNGDGVLDSKDQIDLGKWGTFGSPLTLGVNLTLKYKNWTLFVLGNGQFGAKGMKNNGYYYMSGDAKYSVFARGRWTPETADVATHPRLTTQSSANNSAASTFWLYSTDRFNLRKVQLTYDFPEEMFNGKWVKALSIYLNGNDLLTIAKERKLMETNVGYAPQTRFYNLGVKVTL